MSAWRILLIAALSAPARPEALLLFRAESGMQFADTTSLVVNGKDKVFVLGEKAAQPAGDKLPAVHLEDTLIRDAESGVLAIYAPGTPPRFLYPDGLPKKARPSASEAWKAARIGYKKTKSEKTFTEVPTGQFIAFLPGGVQQLAQMCMDDRALAMIGGPKGAFSAQLDITGAAVAAYGANPAMAAVGREVGTFLRVRHERFAGGIESSKSLEEGLRMSALSAKAWANDPEQQKYRRLLTEEKQWLDRRIAILRALLAGTQWDKFLLGYRDFEKHQYSFPELMAKHDEALKSSLGTHWESGKARLARGDYRRAYYELRLAAAKQPSNSELRKQLSMAWTEYSRQVAVDRRSQRKQLSPGEQEAVSRFLHFAERYREQKKLDEALKSVLDAEKIDPNSLPVLLGKAEILGSRGEIVHALTALDQYDLLAVDDERAAGSKLRNDLLFQLTDSMKELRQQIALAWKGGEFYRTLHLAKRGLLADEDDPEVLYYAGAASLALRDRKTGSALLEKYLEVSNTLDADRQRRHAVSLLRATLPPAIEATVDGEPNWLSGYRVANGVYYCPVSLAFQPKISKIQASKGMAISFNWANDQLQSITPSFEKEKEATNEGPFTFGYDEHGQAVFVSAAKSPPPVSKDPDTLIRTANVLLRNSELVDPMMLERLTGKPTTVGVAGNRFFHPFVWDRPYFFRLHYDDQGRVSKADQLAGQEGGRGAPVSVEFEWNGLKLMSVKAYSAVEGGAKVLMYERTQQYQGDQLTGEEVRAGNKTSRIKYVYNGSQLVSAECDKDESVDGRSREVLFLSSAQRTRRR